MITTDEIIQSQMPTRWKQNKLEEKLTQHTIIKLHKCKWCGKEYIKTHNRQEYCKENGDYCKTEARREQNRKARITYYHKYKKTLTEEQRYGLGSSNIGPHMNPDTKKEYFTVHREAKRIGLKT